MSEAQVKQLYRLMQKLEGPQLIDEIHLLRFRWREVSFLGRIDVSGLVGG
jgi:hypothetical protein